MANNISLVIRREFLERVKKKSFIITTILMPVFMLAMMAAPALIMMVTGSEERGITVIDETGTIGARLQSDKETHFTLLESTPLDSALADTEVAGVLYIPAGIMDGKVSPRLYTNGSSSIALENNVSSQIDGIIEEERLKQYDIENLDKILEEVHSDVKLMSIRNDKEDGESQSASAAVSYLIGIILTFLLYMCLLLYGQMVMTSIIEEKNNRVLEIVVSSVKPTHLMLGKICGIGLVAVTQILIWGVLIAAMSAFVLPAIIPDTALTEMSALNAGTLDATSASMDVEILQAMSLMSNVGYILQLFGLLILFLTGGFLLYAAIYAAIGSAVDNIQDASQLQSFVIFPIIIGIIFGMTAASDASSPAAIWTSFIPFTSPMVMMARVPSGIPMWEIGLSLAILYASFLLMVWIAAKIYRVGIFMYGKKPSIKDLIRWARYK
ncbi:ABC transporter permease [Paramuribaculum intestinale]|jgi:ABC-2 type transport system permease protein|uniref:ABC transporter permease n=1 Tax=Paramuribaculum intestinale TaxID=2094151 RepID=A0A2V1J126_9BACT|nr:ABC transporter permease [Paramuribaculum intestinale]ROS92783.1 ABC transporter permease [Muribaculaceae bacterium Isolate-043 (Harlan)]ROT16464.1 ABC transporter permease [Muribaculaceae bacterium Isolate-105 (HZI)]RXE62977.1 ABC transporter permease [Muribaculaceae bacterium Isolate-004 (NCI)]MCX4330340.1 ABC transporter permease [Paramuribaculum intestinale]PWB08846.1 ABC transporter permease [Paramuribaculum intestinale]